jgi:aconitate hydratase
VRAVIVETFERIHRSNLVGMGVLPLQFTDGKTWKSLGLTGAEVIDIPGLEGSLKPRQTLHVNITHADGRKESVAVMCRIDTVDEIEYFKNGGILHYVLRGLAKAA